ncbi:hypothetical protein KAI68_05325, partial [bacterium]|nr:hypothetical protein [bacterium]
MIKKWEFIYAPCEKDARRYKIRIDGNEEDLFDLIKKVGKDCGKSFVPISKLFNWVFYVYNVNKEEKGRIENTLQKICPMKSKEKENKEGVENSAETETTPSLEYILENIVNYEKKTIKKEGVKEKAKEEIKEEVK